jgi:phosphate transport system protein
MTVRAAYHHSLRMLQDEMLVLACMVDEAIGRSVEALEQRDAAAARQIVQDDRPVNHKRFEIEEQAIRLIATQQPMAGDLRTIIAILSIIVELERIGDYAAGIAKLVLLLGDEPPIKGPICIPRMAEKGRAMLRRSMDAFIARDAEAARAIASEDDEVDALHDQLYRELLNLMIESPSTITRATYLIWVSHNLERIADRTTNICERVVFLVTGRMEEINVSTY